MPSNKVLLIIIAAIALICYLTVKIFGMPLWMPAVALIALILLFTAYMDYFIEKTGKEKFKDIIYVRFKVLFKIMYFFQIIDIKIINRINELEEKNKVKTTLKNGKRVITLEDLSKIWMEDANGRTLSTAEETEPEIQAPVKTSNVKTEIADERPLAEATGEEIRINNPVLAEFIKNERILQVSKSNKNMSKVILAVIKIFDEYGDEPSVVDIAGDHDRADKTNNQFDALRNVSILQHSIDVFDCMVNKHKGSNIVKPKAFIASFCHDLGKISAYRSGSYVTGKHPDASYQALIKLDGFSELKEDVRTDLIDAVRLHHMSPNNPFAIELQEADRKARSIELDRYVMQGNTAVEAIAPITPKPQESTAYTREEIILDWLNIDQFLKRIGEKINVVTGKRWEAFSMSDGSVYVQLGLIESTLKRMAAESFEANAELLEDRLKRQKVYNWLIDKELRNRGLLNERLVAKGFIGNKFNVSINDVSQNKSFFYVVFTAKAFGDIEEMEKKRRATEKICDINKVEIVEKNKEEVA